MAKVEKMTLLAAGELVQRIEAAKAQMEQELSFQRLPTTAVLHRLVVAGLDQFEASRPGAGRPERKRVWAPDSDCSASSGGAAGYPWTGEPGPFKPRRGGESDGESAKTKQPVFA